MLIFWRKYFDFFHVDFFLCFVVMKVHVSWCKNIVGEDCKRIVSDQKILAISESSWMIVPPTTRKNVRTKHRPMWQHSPISRGVFSVQVGSSGRSSHFFFWKENFSNHTRLQYNINIFFFLAIGHGQKFPTHFHLTTLPLMARVLNHQRVGKLSLPPFSKALQLLVQGKDVDLWWPWFMVVARVNQKMISFLNLLG